MILDNKYIFNRKNREIPRPSCLPIAIAFALLSMCILIVIPPVVSGIDVRMPSMHTRPVEMYDDFRYITLFFDKRGIIVDGSPTSVEKLSKLIKKRYSRDKNIDVHDVKIFVRADKRVSYNSIVSLLEALNYNGYRNITLVGGYARKNNDFNT